MGQIQKILTVTEKSIPCRIDYVQGSNAIPILFRIIDFEIPTGAIANIYKSHLEIKSITDVL